MNGCSVRPKGSRQGGARGCDRVVTAVGADGFSTCELDAAALGRVRVLVDEVDANLKAGDIRRALSCRKITREHIAGELREVLTGTLKGETSPGEITIGKLVGIGAQDVAAAEAVLGKLGSTQGSLGSRIAQRNLLSYGKSSRHLRSRLSP